MCRPSLFVMGLLLRVKTVCVCVCWGDSKFLIGETVRNWPWFRDIASLLDRINSFCTLPSVPILCSDTHTHTHRSISRQRSITIICFCPSPVMRARLLGRVCLCVCLCAVAERREGGLILSVEPRKLLKSVMFPHRLMWALSTVPQLHWMPKQDVHNFNGCIVKT